MIASLQLKMKKFLSDDKFSEILTGSAFALAARVVGTGLALLTSIFVARVYGADMIGVLAIVQAFMMMASIIAVLGTNVSILRLIPEHLAKHSPTSAYKVYRRTQYLVSLVSILGSVILFFAADWIADTIFSKPHFSFYIGITALCVIFKALMDLNTEALRGLRLIRPFALMQVFPHAAMLFFLLGTTAFSSNSNIPVYAQLAAWVVTVLFGAFIMNRAFRRQMRTDDVVQVLPFRELLSISAPMLMTASMAFIIGQMGVLVLGMYRPVEEVGYYSAAVSLATLTSFVLQAINSMAAPKFSELFHTEQLDDLFYVAKKSTMLIFWATIPVLMFLVVLGRPILSLFGEGFISAYLPMLILVAGQFVNSISGSTGYFMNMTGHQKVFRNIVVAVSVLNLVLCFVMIPRFGIFGSAIAGSVCLASWNISALVYIKYKYGRTIGYIPFAKLRHAKQHSY